MEQIVQSLLQIQISVKLLHWQTKSYAKHIATDKLVESLLPKIDKFVEILQGKRDKRVEFSSKQTLQLGNFTSKSDVQLLKAIKIWLQKTLPQMLNTEKDTDLLNIRDDMLGDVNQTLYLFTFK